MYFDRNYGLSMGRKENHVMAEQDNPPRFGYLTELSFVYVSMYFGCCLVIYWISNYGVPETRLFGFAGVAIGSGAMAAYQTKSLVQRHFHDRRKTWRTSYVYRLTVLLLTFLFMATTALYISLGLTELMLELRPSYNPFKDAPTEDALLAYFLDACLGFITTHAGELIPFFKHNVEVERVKYFEFSASIVGLKILMNVWYAATLTFMSNKLFSWPWPKDV